MSPFIQPGVPVSLEGLLTEYLAAITDTYRRGDATEESYYPALRDFLRSAAVELGQGDSQVTVLPRPTDHGNPDFRVWDGRHHVTGYVEAKGPGTDLDRIEESEQLRRYRDSFPNVILTDFLEFRLYRDGGRVARVQAGRQFVLTELDDTPPPQRVDELKELLELFLAFSVPATTTAQELAHELAKRTRFLRKVVEERLHAEAQGDAPKELSSFFQAFRKYLIGHLDRLEFSDLYAQTLTYGLFAARTRTEGEFTREGAHQAIPSTIGILRDLFRFVSSGDLPEELRWVVEEIVQVLSATDAAEILDRYYREGRGEDPIVHFYETFLAVYDPKERERRGVYYTPEPVVSYIVRGVHWLLKERFGRHDGLASPGVTLLDPAAGTMTFVARAVREAVQEHREQYGQGATAAFIDEHVLRNFYAFELMMAPYAVGHLKMAFLLEELSHRLADDERFPLYLTNTLEMEELEQTGLPFMRALAEESHLAYEVKKETPILVILGNPPYSVSSQNRSDFIEKEMAEYKKDLHGERNLMPLSDDYVKFLRFAQWKIEEAGEGVVGMITNHSWLDNVTFRGMRQSLMASFDEIFLLDLHGNSLKKERAPDGGPDENVFDIRQGVGIWFFVKNGRQDGETIRIMHSEQYGLRTEKYAWLERETVSSTDWEEISPHAEFHLFVPRDEEALEVYETFPSVKDLFRIHSSGIKTHRDHFVIDFERDTLENRIRTFLSEGLSDEEAKEAFQLKDNQDWKLSEKRKLIREDEGWKEKITRVLYYPFDRRPIFYHPDAIDRGREGVMRHMLHSEAIGLCIGRAGRVTGESEWDLAFVTDIPQDTNIFYRGGSVLFPLYLLPDHPKDGLFGDVGDQADLRLNLSAQIVPTLEAKFASPVSPIDILRYIYAVLFAPSYREKYAEFLNNDFPRIPFAADEEVFRALSNLGKRLIDLHFLNPAAVSSPTARFHGEGSNRIARTKRDGFRYEEEAERMWINKEQWFGPIYPGLFEYRIGGFQVLEKWLRDRKGRVLALQEIRRYLEIVTAIARTINIQEEIDAIYPQVEKERVGLAIE